MNELVTNRKTKNYKIDDSLIIYKKNKKISFYSMNMLKIIQIFFLR